jgi:NAD(P)-dependent dehydrogenase (short-subunit alcohol dehydrogenase family)
VDVERKIRGTAARRLLSKRRSTSPKCAGKDCTGTLRNLECAGYAAAKGAILELTSEWAIELSSYGIRVNAVVPAEVMTSQYEKWLTKFADPQEKRRSITSRIPLGHE